MRELVDPSPTRDEVTGIWDYFGHACAYCARTLDRVKKEGHIDHLVSAAQGGPNHISNRVLSCATCNEKEKLDRDWREFLRFKAPEVAVFSLREARITKWRQAMAAVHPVDQTLLSQAANYAGEVNELFERRFKELRTSVRARRDAV